MKILVVDDEQDIKVLFEQMFRNEVANGLLQFAFAFSGEEALNYLKEHEHQAILILSDVNMPGMTGFELLTKIKSSYNIPPLFIMMITAYGDEYTRQTALKLGADDFLTKPIDFKTLKEKLKNL